MKVLNTADLFCGAGGATTGLELALGELGLKHRGFAVNHWNVAVETMKANHPDVNPIESTVEAVVPAEAVPGGELDLLWASPSCTHHSRAKGGRPVANQLRAQPELILTWLDQIFVRRLIVENVPEIVSWGPLTLTGMPLKSKVGACFDAWIASIRARNYDVEWRILNCADYGDATTRSRFFLQAIRRGCGVIKWPDPEYSSDGEADLFGQRKKWRGIGECIDWNDLGESISTRKRPLCENTMRRIQEGIRKFHDQSFIFDFFKNGVPSSPKLPLGTQTTHDRYALVNPFVLDFMGTDNPESNCRLIDPSMPLPAIQAGGGRFGLATPFVIPMEHGGRQAVRSCNHPLPTITTAKGGAFALATPFVIAKQTNPCMRTVDKPSPTITTTGSMMLCSPIVIGQQSCSAPRSVNEPFPTISTAGAISMATPVKENGTVIDVLFRMLKPEELALAHSFPVGYVLTGRQQDKTRQIGNSVPVMTAKALCKAALSTYTRGNNK